MQSHFSVAGSSRSFADLHTHSSASFDSLSDPRKMIDKAIRLGLTHLAITDHERIDGAQRARDLAPPQLQVIVGEEIRSADGDMLGLFLERVDPAGAIGGRDGRGHPCPGRPGGAAASLRQLPQLGRQQGR